MHKPTDSEIASAKRYVRLMTHAGDLRFDRGDIRGADRHWLAAGSVEGWLFVARRRGQVCNSLKTAVRRCWTHQSKLNRAA